MNKIYKLIWSQTANAFVAVSELATARDKSSSTTNNAVSSADKKAGIFKPVKTALVLSMLFVLPHSVMAGTGLAGGTATGIDAIAVGESANATGIKSGAIGPEAKALGDDSFAVGTRAKALANYSTALGNQSTAEKEYDLAAGYNAIASGGQSTAVGFGSKSTGNAANAIGGSSVAAGQYSTAVGQEARAEADFTLAAGYKANASGGQSMAVGFGSKSTGNAATALGSASVAAGKYSTAVGQEAHAEADFTLAAGYKANASGGQSMAVGFGSKSTGNAATAIGSSSVAAGDFSIAIGQESKTAAGQSFATALGYKSNASGWASFAQGPFALASGDGSISIGDSSSATGTNSIAIGGASGANLDNSVALGSRSRTSTNAVTVTSATVGGITYGGFTGAVSSVGSQISVGNTGNERQIKHVAAGTISQTSTDAINGSQLFSTQKALGNLASSTSSALGGGSNVQPDGSLSLPTYVITNNPKTPGTKVTVHTVGDALSALDSAVNVPLVFKGNTGNDISKKLGDTLSIKGGLANADAATATNLRVDEENGELKIKLARNLTDLDSVTVGNTVLNPNGLTVGGPTGPSITTNGINAGNKAIKNVAPGVNGTDAANVDQLKTAQAAATTKVEEADGIKVKPTPNADGSTTYTVSAKTDGTTTKIDGKGNIAAVTTPLTTNTDGKVNTPAAPNALATAGDIANAINNSGWKLAADGTTGTELINPSDTVTFKTGSSNLTVKRDGANITYDLARNINVDSVQIGANGIRITNDGNNIKIGDKDGNATKITNVKAGEAGTDAVNVSQLKAAQAAATTKVEGDKGVSVTPKTNADGSTTYTVAAKTDGTTTKIDDKGNIAAVTAPLTTNTDGKVNTPAAPNALATAGDIANAINNSGWKLAADGTTGTELINPSDTVTFKTGSSNLTVKRDGANITYDLAKDININSVQFNDGPKITNDGDNIKVGDKDGNATKITNVAAGTDATDAVNMSQLEKAQAAATTKVEEADGIKVVPTKNADGSTTYTVSAKTDGTTTTINADGKIAAVTTTFTPSTDGKVGAPVGNGDSLVTANTVADAINNSGWKLAADGTTGTELINPSDTVTFKTGSSNLTVKRDGANITYDLAKDININSVQFNDGPKITNDGDNIKVGDKDGNATKITNVAAGTDATDAVNMSQLEKAQAAATTKVEAGDNMEVTPSTNADGSKTYTVATKKDVNFDSVTVGPVVINKDGINAGDKKITNVADGVISATSKDAINGSQLYALGTGVQNIIGGNTTYDPTTGTYVNNNIGNTGKNNINDAIASVNDAATKAKTTVTQGDNIVVTPTTNADGSSNYKVAVANDLNVNSVTSNVVTVGSVKIDKTHVDAAGNTIISGVGKGELSSTSTDAVNGSQLYATNQKVTQNTTDITNINTTLDKGLNFSADSGTTVNRKLGDTVAITGDKNIVTTTTANGVQIKLSDNIDVNNVNVSQSITVAEGATVNMGGNVIQNVGAGVNGTDAVNVNQLNSVASNINNRITTVGNIANAGVAQAIATAGLPQAYLPGKNMMAIAGGTYEGEAGYAIGFSTISDNGKWIIKATGSGNSRGKFGASIGAGYQW